MNAPITFGDAPATAQPAQGVTPEALAAAMAMLQRGAISAAPTPAAPAIVPAASLAAAGPWARPAAAAGVAAQGVLVPVTVPLPQGWAAPVYLFFGPEHAASLDAVAALLGQLSQAGAPVKLYPPRDDRDGGGAGGYGGRGRGGYGGGGGYGRRRYRD